MTRHRQQRLVLAVKADIGRLVTQLFQRLKDLLAVVLLPLFAPFVGSALLLFLVRLRGRFFFVAPALVQDRDFQFTVHGIGCSFTFAQTFRGSHSSWPAPLYIQ